MGKKKKEKFNHLIHEKSPYLLQHAENPVDWYPWKEKAFEKAREEDKPIFLSIGYATCHWCHVMAHESFEDDEIAELLNRNFVSIKVDREERPDIDQVYMSVCQALTGQGGWPLTIFMTPERVPFFAGTYFPKTGRMGMIGFADLLGRIANLWATDRQRVVQQGEEIRRAVQRQGEPVSGGPLTSEALHKGYQQLARSFDETWGGFGKAPKFPTPHHLTFLLRCYRRTGELQARRMVEITLERMRRGGIFDQVGLGFHRYSVDEKWLIPHFEKMLYDQALLAMAYTEAYQVFGNEEFEKTARETFAYVLRDMTSAQGGFYSAEDADSEGQEGRFYFWTPEEVLRHLGEDVGNLFCRFYGISAQGNFEGASVPHVNQEWDEFARREGRDRRELEEILKDAREKLFQVREERVHPLKDDKIITSWNGLMIAAMAKGYQVFHDPAFSQISCQAADFILQNLRSSSGRLHRRYRLGERAIPGFLEDYAFLVWGLIELYEAIFEARYLEEAVLLNETMIDLFWDKEKGGFYFSGRDHEPLISRPKEVYDGATPSGNSVAALNLLRLARMTGRVDWETKADQMVRVFSQAVAETPIAYTQFLNFLDFFLGPSREIVIAGDPESEETRAMIRTVQQGFHPNKVLLLRAEGDPGNKIPQLCPFTSEMRPVEGKTTAYLCERYSCLSPVTDLSALQKALA